MHHDSDEDPLHSQNERQRFQRGQGVAGMGGRPRKGRGRRNGRGSSNRKRPRNGRGSRNGRGFYK